MQLDKEGEELPGLVDYRFRAGIFQAVSKGVWRFPDYFGYTEMKINIGSLFILLLQ